MKVFTKLVLAFVVMLFASSVIFAQNANSVRNELLKTYKQSGQVELVQKMLDQPTITQKYKPVKLDIKGTTAYAFVAYDPSGVNPVGPAYFDTDFPGTITSLGPNGASDFIAGGSWAEGEWYGEVYGTGQLYTLNPSSGAMTLVGTGTTGINAMAYDPTTQTMYGCNYGASTGLYTINLNNGAQTYVGDVGIGALIIGLACDASGNLFGADLVGDQLVSIDKSTGAGTVIGPLGIFINYAQDLEYDNENDILYLAGYTTQGELYTVNPSTGACTFVGAFQGGAEMCGLAFEYTAIQYTNDIGIQSILSPSSGIGLGDEVVTVRIKNFGTAAQSNFDISYSLDGGTPVMATITNSIAGGATYDYTFPGTVDLSALGEYDFEACTYLSGDENPGNDCKTKTVENQLPEYCTASTSTEDEYIANVLFGDINNSSGWQGGVADYTDITTTLAPGASADMTVSNPVPYSADLVSVWIDWNQDYQFSLTDEEFDLTNVGGTGATFTGTITVPANQPGGEYRMRIRLLWNVAPNPCGAATYGEVEDYTLIVPGGTNFVFEYDFENFTAGGQVACQFPLEWTTWSNAPCGAEDAYISTEQAHSGANSFVIEGVNDLVKEFEDYTTGHYKISFWIYVPDGYIGYYNTLQDFAGGSSQWGMQVYFDEGAAGGVDAGGAMSATFTFPYDTWMLNEIDIDLDNDWAELYLDGTFLVGWVWSSGAFGTGTLNKLDANDFYAYTGASGTGTPKAFFDDYTLEAIVQSLNPPLNLTADVTGNDVALEWDAPAPGSGTLEGYNVYRDDAVIDYTTGTTYDDNDLDPGSYVYNVTAVYTEGESGYSNDATAVIEDNTPPTPTNLVATGQTDGVLLEWDAVGAGEWIQWDAGVNNGNGIGLTAGGTFNVASHWAPSDLGPYNGFTLSKVSFFPNADPAATFVIKVWTGAAGTTLVSTQNVTSFTVDTWNEITLGTPVLINSATDLWFGYTVTHASGNYPAGCDDGPAVQGKGDMISLGGAWESMSASYGLDYNWNLAGFVSASDGKGAAVIPMIGTPNFVNLNSTLASATENGQGGNQSVKFVPSATKDFTYNVYWGTTMGGPYNLLTPAPITPTQYLHTLPAYGWNYYVVTSYYNGYESEYSNEASILWTWVNENNLANTQIFPNPAINAVNITSDYTIKSVKVYNHAGQVIANEPVDANNYQFNTSEFSTGMYLFMIETTEGTMTQRIIIE
jgi:hypothetical protein